MKRLAIALFALIISFSAQAQLENSLLWKITSPQGKESYLFGTYHLLGSDYLKGHEKVNSVWLNAERVVVETVIDSSKLMEVAQASLMPGNSLKKMVDSADYQLLKQKLEPVLGMDLAGVDQLKPMALTAAYALEMASRATPDTFLFEGQPIDIYFASKAGKKQEVIALEDMMEQLEILYGSESLEEQAQALVSMLKDEEETNAGMEGVIQAYMKQDLNGMLAISEEMEEAFGDLDVVLDKRNVKWIATLNPLLNEGGNFVAVGALHLPGKKGLIALLRQEGFRVEAVL